MKCTAMIETPAQAMRESAVQKDASDQEKNVPELEWVREAE